MDIATKQRVRFQRSLFSKEMPFSPSFYQFMYVETSENERINSYFHKNIETVTNILGKSFYYLPVMLDSFAQIVEYNNPGIDCARLEKSKPDAKWLQDFYREIISFKIDKESKEPELPLNIFETPLLMRYEYITQEGYLFTLFPLQYNDDEQFQQLLYAISREPHVDSGIRYSTITEYIPLNDPKDRADEESINVLAKEIQERMYKLRLLGVNDYVIRKLIDLPEATLSPLRITSDYRIFLPGYNNMEIVMPTLSKVVYFFFLRHPNGMRFKDMIDYRDELMEIYYRLSNRYDNTKMEQSIDELVDSTRNSINEKCSRIRSAFVSQFSDELAKNYYITGYCASAKKITLDRNLVIDEANILR